MLHDNKKTINFSRISQSIATNIFGNFIHSVHKHYPGIHFVLKTILKKCDQHFVSKVTELIVLEL